MTGNKRGIMAEPRKIRVTRLQVELAQAKVEADRALRRRPDPVLVKVAAAAPSPPARKLAG